MKTKAIVFIPFFVFFATLVVAQKPNTLFQQGYDPNGNTFLSAFDPGSPIDFAIADNFWNVSGSINHVAFYGITRVNTTFGFEERIPANPEPFMVRFYEYEVCPIRGLLPPAWGNPFWSGLHWADIVYTGSFTEAGITYWLYRFDITLNETVTMKEGWFSVQMDAGKGSGTWFYWLGSSDGDDLSYMRNSIERKLINDFSFELLSKKPPADQVNLKIFQLGYVDLDEAYKQTYSDVGLIRYEYQPWDNPTFLNVYIQNPEGEAYWAWQAYLPSKEHSSGLQTASFSFDLQPLGITPGTILEEVRALILRTNIPLTETPALPPPVTWPRLTVKQMLDNTFGGTLTEIVTSMGILCDWPFKPDPDIWNKPFKSLVFRGFEIPNIDLDSVNHPPRSESNYAGDRNACVPAAFSNSIKWLESKYKNSSPSLTTNQTHREVLEELSRRMNRIANKGTNTAHQIAGKMKYAQQHRLPVITKVQVDTLILKKGVDVRPLGSSYAALNQTSESCKPDWAWLVQELKNGEDVELTYQFWDDSLKRYKSGHCVALAGVLEIDTLLRAIWYNHDRNQSKRDSDCVLQEFSFVKIIDGWLVLPGLSNRRFTARVTSLVSESYDPTKTYERISGTLAGLDGVPIDLDKLEIEARLWNNPEDVLSLGKGNISYKVIKGVAFFDIDYDSFKNPPQPGDRIKITFWDGNAFVTRMVQVPEGKGPVFLEIVIDNQLTTLNFTEWQEIVIPPWKRLYIHFLQPPAPGCNRNADFVVWNGSSWVIPPWGHFNNNAYGQRKSILNDTNKNGILRLHHSDESNPGTFFLTLSDAKDDTSPGNQHEHANINLGGRDASNVEFGDIQEATYHYTYEIGALLGEFPGTIGAAGVQELHFQFESFDNMFWSDMKLTIDLLNVLGEGFLHITQPGKNAATASVYISPGQEVVSARLGEFIPPGYHSLVISLDPSLQFDVDCFNMSSLIITLNPDDFIQVNGDGSVDVEPQEGPYRFGQALRLTGIPGVGSRFVNWEGVFTPVITEQAPKSEENPIEIIIDKDTHIIANFVINTYNITAVPNNEEYGTVTGSGTYDHFENVVLKASPAGNYHFVCWTEDDEWVMDGDEPAGSEYTFMAEKNRDLIAHFAFDTYTLSYTAGQGGSIEGNPEQTVGHGADGTPVHAVPNEGHHFTGWSDGIKDNPRTDTNVTANLEVEAEFAVSSYLLGLEVEPPGTGQVSGAGEYDFQEQINLTATPEEGYDFVRWTNEQNETVSDQGIFVFVMPAYDITLTAHFLLTTYTVSFVIENQLGESIAGAVIILDQTANPPGDYVFEEIAPGQYPYAVTAEYYLDFTGQLEVIDQAIQVTVVMEADGTGIAITQRPEISLFPNPARNTLTIESSVPFSHIRLLDMLGQRVISRTVNDTHHELSVSDLKNGLYFIQVFGSWGMNTWKVQIVN